MRQLLGLFLHRRRLTIDPAREVAETEDRWFWLFKVRRVIPFLRILHVQYDYEDAGSFFRPFRKNGDGAERFSVSLSLLAPWEKVVLFDFVGEGSGYDRSFLERVLLDLDRTDLSGNQAGESRQFALLVRQFTGKPLV